MLGWTRRFAITFANQAAELARRARPVAELGPEDPPTLRVCVVASDREHLLDGLRAQSARAAIRELGRDAGYRLEDLVGAALLGDAETAAWLERRLGVAVDVEPGGSAFALGAVFRARVGPSPSHPRYARGADGRIRLEALEFHVVEHCNLRCANCCNMSPFVDERTMPVDELRALLGRLSKTIAADVVKVMGGEPLLHPDIAGVVRVLRASGIAPRVRVFTNGLRLGAMPEAFWEALDELTISTYASAPVKPALLEIAREEARRRDIVLNVKVVDEFSQVLSPRYQADDDEVAAIHRRCWLRHRCMVVRDRRFYTCTRAAYAGEFLARVPHEPPPEPLERDDDGLDIDRPDFAAALERYLARERPLAACRYCFGGDGPTEPHHQLRRADVEGGVLSRRLGVIP